MLPTPEPPPAGLFRWMVDISGWSPGQAEWALLLSLLPEADAAKVMRFVHEVDRKRALVSRLLQRRACVEATGVAWRDVKIERTKGGKPFMANKPKSMVTAANWNFNVSHEGLYVGLAAEPLAVCGIDVTEPFEQRVKAIGIAGQISKVGGELPMEEQLHTFRDQLSSFEKTLIDKCRPDDKKMEHMFRKFWSLKEAFTKGRGDGLGFEFNRCSFNFVGGDGAGGLSPSTAERGTAGQPVARARVAIDGTPSKRWQFAVQALRAQHFVSVARGTPDDVVDKVGAFKATFTQVLSPARLQAELERPEPPFEPKAVEDIVPLEVRDTYRKLAMQGRT